MSDYLERLKADLVEAQKRLTGAQQKMQSFQAEFQAAHADVQSFTRAVETVARREQQEEAEKLQARSGEPKSLDADVPLASGSADGHEVNKTDLIRDAIRLHPGASPADLYDSVKDQVSRTYLYSVLKRLKEHDEVMVRRKKYYFKTVSRIEEAKEKTSVEIENGKHVN